jgi:Putative bacterial sensory transduction regulator
MFRSLKKFAHNGLAGRGGLCALLVGSLLVFGGIASQARADTGSSTSPNIGGAPQPVQGFDSGSQPGQLYQTVTRQQLLSMLQSAGYDAEIDNNGNVNFKINNIKTVVHPYNCDDAHQCKSFGYFVSFINTDIPVELMNEYNLKRRWTHAYLNNGHPAMTWDVLLDGGVSYQYLVRSVNMWRDLLGSFLAALNSKTVQ